MKYRAKTNPPYKQTPYSSEHSMKLRVILDYLFSFKIECEVNAPDFFTYTQLEPILNIKLFLFNKYNGFP